VYGMMPKSNEILRKVTSCLLQIKIITVSRESIKYTCLNAHNQISVCKIQVDRGK